MQKVNDGSCVSSLFDLSAMVVARHLPFEYVESKLVDVPDHIQERIIYYSFPRDCSYIKTYSSFKPRQSGSSEKSAFSIGEQLFKKHFVNNVIQIGFHLTGSVRPDTCAVSGLIDTVSYHVSLTFDRCKITSAHCSCQNRGLSWCPHIVALALFRISKPHHVSYRAPISDTLVKMDRNQLQKLAQYLIASHSDLVLSSAQNLAEGLLDEESTMNKISVREQFRLDLASIANGTFGSGHNAFDGTLLQNTNSGMSSNLPNSHTHGRFFSSGSSEHGRNRSNRHTSATMDEYSTKSRNFTGKIFAQTWLENYRHLQKSKFPLFGYMTLTSSSINQSSSNSLHNNNGSSQSLQVGYSQTNSSYSNPSHCPSRNQVAMVFAKTYELLSIRDKNGPRLLRIITEELLNSASMMNLSRTRRNNRSGVQGERTNWDLYAGEVDENSDDNDGQDLLPRQNNNGSTFSQPPIWMISMWEEVGRLWTCLLLTPEIEASARKEWLECLHIWSTSSYTPRDAIYRLPEYVQKEDSSEVNRESQESFSVFQLARDISHLDFNTSMIANPITREMISDAIDTLSSLPSHCFCPFCIVSAVIAQCWSPQETFITLCLRASALNVTGYEKDGSRLAFLLAKTLLDCLDEVYERLSEKNSLSAANLSRSNSGNSNKGNGQSATISLGGVGSHPRGNFKNSSTVPSMESFQPLIALPLPSHTMPQNYIPVSQCDFYPFGPTTVSNLTQSLNLSFPQPLTNSSYALPYTDSSLTTPQFLNPPYQNNRYRCSPWSRSNFRAPEPVNFPPFCCSETSSECLFHEHGWLGLPGRPIISLVECLLEAASQKTEELSKNGNTASDYIHLALKVGILVLCQQRSLPQSNRALMTVQCQETLLIQLLNTIPRNAITAQIIVPLVCKLMGLRLSSSQQYLSEVANPEDWWWSALGPLVHPDVFPVHVVAELLFGHLLQGESSNPCMGDLAYYVVVRSMRFPILELTSDSIQIGNDNNSTNPRSSEIPVSRRLPPPPSYFHGMYEKSPTSPSTSPTGAISRAQDGSRSTWSRTRQHPALSDAASAAYRRDLAAMEGRQARLAISLILASRQPSARIDHFLRICDRHIHSALSLFTVSREVMAEAIGHRLHTSSNAFTIDEPVLLMNAVANIATSAASPTPTRGQDSSIMLPINFETSPLPSSSIQERTALVTTSFHLALCVAVRTLWPKHHFRRQEFLGWMVSTGILAGPFALKHLVQSWSSYVSTIEGITMLAPTMLNCLSYLQNVGTVANGSGLNTSGRTGGRSGVGRDGSLDPMCQSSPRVYSFHSFSLANLEQIRAAVRAMIVQATSKDPVSCALAALQLTEMDPASFQAVYPLVLNAVYSGRLRPSTLFTAAKYLDSRGFSEQAFPFTVQAIRQFVLTGLQDNHPIAQDVLWSCQLAHRLGLTKLSEFLKVVITNVHCPAVLTEILHRCRAPLPYGPRPHFSLHPQMNHPFFCNNYKQRLSVDVPPLKALLDATINAYIMTTHSRLASISPRQYGDFVDFLARAHEVFSLLKPDGLRQFHQLVTSLCHSYRGKRKLVTLLNERFHSQLS
nr:zinc finger SWIM domain containing protein [Hymenolepis microstoma]